MYCFCFLSHAGMFARGLPTISLYPSIISLCQCPWLASYRYTCSWLMYMGTPTPLIGLNQDGLSRNIPLGRVGQAEEVAEAAVFLAQNSYANNCVLTIDGGLTAGFGPV